MFNKVILIGRVGQDPTLSVSQSGSGICKFSLATTSGFGDKKRTDWHHIVCFGKLADTMSKYVQKGTVLAIDGSIEYSEYEKDGVKRTYTSIIANTATIVTNGKFGKDGDGNDGYHPAYHVNEAGQPIPVQQQGTTNPVDPYFSADPIDESIPF
jgi:single-strand DNA-binding protein